MQISFEWLSSLYFKGKYMKSLWKGIILVAGLASSVVHAEVAVIVNASNTNSVASSDISRIFLGKMKSFNDGSSAVPVNLKSTLATRGEFEDKALGKSSSQVKAYWSKQLFSGKGKPPKELASDADVINFVSSTPGAIGYVEASNVNDSVRVITKF